MCRQTGPLDESLAANETTVTTASFTFVSAKMCSISDSVVETFVALRALVGLEWHDEALLDVDFFDFFDIFDWPLLERQSRPVAAMTVSRAINCTELF